MVRGVFGAALMALLFAGTAHAAPLTIVAAENFYGDVAGQIGGPYVAVTSIMSNPDEDPHLFEADASAARALSAAAIVVYNGVDYDPWMATLLSASPSQTRQEIIVAGLLGRKPGDNPHLWYEPGTMPAFVAALAAKLEQADPAHRAYFAAQAAAFNASLLPLRAEVARLHQHYVGVPVTATEPVFGYMAGAIGLNMRNMAFQLAVMNDTEPGASDIAAFEQDLRTRRVRVLLYNAQASDPTADRMEKIAAAAHVPVVGVSETEPAGKNYQTWMLDQLNALQAALEK